MLILMFSFFILIVLEKKAANSASIKYYCRLNVKTCKITRIRAAQNRKTSNFYNTGFKPDLHECQLPVERSVTLVSSIVVEVRRCAHQVNSVTRLQENKER